MASSVGSVFGGLKKRVDDLGGSLAKLKKQSGNIAKLQAAQDKLAAAKGKGNAAQVARYTAQVEKLSQALTEAGVDTGNLAREQERLASSIAKSEAQLGRFTRLGASLERLKGSAKGVGDAFGNAKEKIGGAFTRLGVAAGVVGGAVAGVGYLTAEFIDQGDALADQAEGLNMSTKALQTWQFAAGTVGIESDKLAGIFSKLQSKISEGSDGTKEAFAALGINFGKLRAMRPDQQLTHITEAFARLPDTVNKTALANEIFGKSGFKLLPVLSQGAKGLAAIYEEAKKTGYILGDETNDAVNKADAAFNQLKLQLAGFKNQALAPLLPVFTDLVQQLGRIVTEHGPRFTAWIQTAGKSFMENLAPAIGNFVTNDLPPLVSNIASVVTGIASMASTIADAVGGWGNLGAVMLGLNFAPSIIAIGGLVVSLGKLASAFWALNSTQIVAGFTAIRTAIASMGTAVYAAVGPWGLFAAAVGMAALAIYQNWEPISKWWMENVYDPIYNSIGSLVEKFNSFTSFVSSPFKTLFGSEDTSALTDSARAKLGAMNAAGSALSPAARQAAGQIMPANAMPGTATNNVKQDFVINVTAPNADPSAIANKVKSAIKSTPLYDTTGVLAPQ